MAKKLFKKLWPLLLPICGITYYIILGKIDGHNFYTHEINSKMIKKEWYAGRQTGVKLENGLSFDTAYEGVVEIGDSISKPSNTFFMKIYRKNGKGKYVLIKTVDNQ